MIRLNIDNITGSILNGTAYNTGISRTFSDALQSDQKLVGGAAEQCVNAVSLFSQLHCE